MAKQTNHQVNQFSTYNLKFYIQVPLENTISESNLCILQHLNHVKRRDQKEQSEKVGCKRRSFDVRMPFLTLCDVFFLAVLHSVHTSLVM